MPGSHARLRRTARSATASSPTSAAFLALEPLPEVCGLTAQLLQLQQETKPHGHRGNGSAPQPGHAGNGSAPQPAPVKPRAAGGRLTDLAGQRLTYNKDDLRNPSVMTFGDGGIDWVAFFGESAQAKA